MGIRNSFVVLCVGLSVSVHKKEDSLRIMTLSAGFVSRQVLSDVMLACPGLVSRVWHPVSCSSKRGAQVLWHPLSALSLQQPPQPSGYSYMRQPVNQGYNHTLNEAY